MRDERTRREVLAASAAATVAATLPAVGQPVVASSAQPGSRSSATVSGVVTEAGPDGTRPLSGVLVSNGRDVTRTDTAGRYGLAVVSGQAVFVIKPSGYQLPLAAETNLPQFSRIYEPDGTPAALAMRYEGLPPAGPLPASVDFQLTRVNEPNHFDVILFTDPQPESTAEIEYIRDDIVAGLVGGDGAAFGITCGDIAFDDLSVYTRINRLIGRIGLPWWNIGGNHDLDFEAPDAARSRDTFKRVFGAPYYAHEHGGTLFIMLDNVEYLGAAPGTQPGTYRGFISADQLTFVRNLLQATPADRLVVLIMHIPLTTYLDPTVPAQNTVNAADLLALLGGRPCVSFAGHTHTTEHHYLSVPGGSHPHHHHVLTAVSGSWWSGPLDHRGIACADSHDGTPNGYHVLSIDGASYTTRFVPAAEPKAKQLRISLDTQIHAGSREVEARLSESTLLRSPITAEQAAGTLVVVNLFDGGPRSSVSMSLDDGLSIAMERTSRPDPFVVQLYGRYPETIKKWVSPRPSSHVWQARLPAGLERRAHSVRIVANDEYGRKHQEVMVLEIE